MLEVNCPHFAIVGYDDVKSTYANIGTGFFINNRGTFITSAHTFKKNTRKFFALLEGEFYSLPEPILFRYKEFDEQTPPVHEDIYIGQFDEIETKFYTLTSAKIIQAGETLVFKGFSSSIYEDNILRDFNDIAAEVNLLVANAKGFVKDYEIARIKESSLTGIFTQYGFNQFTPFSIEGEITNGISFVLTANIRLQSLILSNPYTNLGQNPAGFSGGPVICNDEVIGMLISQKAGISSDYIIQTLSDLKII
ncbi:hypothetical protein [Sphingobacterium multivorum]|uniref:hypothetical protein n=1 Tax=Sphingobacterium multivorum TaxID=28454 RepID=UPI0028A5B2C2|nr:hypothetical protein [Sphingobacterium multivorum]